ncbi:MAG: transposase [Clostridiales bacterium]|nr:transposase [Clostridiales bacterium]
MREPRISYDGAVFHVTTRCNNKEHILSSNLAKRFIIKQLKEYNKKFDYEVLGYVIMDNHYHILIKTHKDSISTIMFNLNNVVAKFLNTFLDRTGHALEKRYHCRLIEDERQLLATLRYIHRNPVRANICEDVNNYIWSSHCFYKNGINRFINTNFILSIINGSDKSAAINSYVKLCCAAGKINSIEEDKELVTSLLGIEEQKLCSYGEFIEFKRTVQKTLEEIRESLNISTEILLEMKSGSRNKEILELKKKFILGAVNEKHRHSDIAEYLTLSKSSITKLVSATQVKME